MVDARARALRREPGRAQQRRRRADAARALRRVGGALPPGDRRRSREQRLPRLPRLRAALGRSARRGVRTVGARDPRRAARHRARRAGAAVDAGRHRRTRARVPRAGRRRRDHARVDVSRPRSTATREVVIECDTRLVPLFARSFPTAEVRAQTHDEMRRESMHDFDRAIPGRQPDPLVPPDARRVPRPPFVPRPRSANASRRGGNGWPTIGPGPYVGVSWRSKIQTAERRLEYTRLDEWGDIFATPGVTWVNLQYDDCNRELRDAEKRFGVQHPPLGLARPHERLRRGRRADRRALDLVVAPFNAVAMLSGALGVRTVAMGNRYGWGELGSGRMPWQPSIVVASRMPNEEWDEVLAVRRARSRARRRDAQPPTKQGLRRTTCST